MHYNLSYKKLFEGYEVVWRWVKFHIVDFKKRF